MTETPDAVQRRIVAVQVVGGIGNGAGLAVGGLLLKDITGSSAWAGMAVVMLTLGAAAFTIPLPGQRRNTVNRTQSTTGSTARYRTASIASSTS